MQDLVSWLIGSGPSQDRGTLLWGSALERLSIPIIQRQGGWLLVFGDVVPSPTFFLESHCAHVPPVES